RSIVKGIRSPLEATRVSEEEAEYISAEGLRALNKKEREKLCRQLEKEMREASRQLNFERAAELRDLLFEIRAMGKKWAPADRDEAAG
ncbi:MAG: hypothetical protein GX989_06805, partial [Firmicutes bacterium]|nr:hypothetical protein [Bacillota bacterium]